MLKFGKSLNEFIGSAKDFRVIYSTHPTLPLAQVSTKRILVLDSSFNPPHLAHYALAREALKYYSLSTETAIQDSALVLMLSVKNADKVTPDISSLEHRLYMMYLMARFFHQSFEIDVSIALTTHAKFVDKSVAMTKYLHDNLPDSAHVPETSFLVGFDTLQRILDPKYYLPDKLSDRLAEFMQSTKIFCLTRPENVEAFNEQMEFVHNLRKGALVHVPGAWSKSVHVQSLDTDRDRMGQVSSSKIRKAYELGAPEDVPVIPEIREYIVKHGLYQGSGN